MSLLGIVILIPTQTRHDMYMRQGIGEEGEERKKKEACWRKEVPQ